MDYAHVDPKSPLLTAALVFICLDVLLVNWDNALNSVPGNGDRISNYVRAVSALLINLPFFIIRVLLFMDEVIIIWYYANTIIFIYEKFKKFFIYEKLSSGYLSLCMRYYHPGIYLYNEILLSGYLNSCIHVLVNITWILVVIYDRVLVFMYDIVLSE